MGRRGRRGGKGVGHRRSKGDRAGEVLVAVVRIYRGVVGVDGVLGGREGRGVLRRDGGRNRTRHGGRGVVVQAQVGKRRSTARTTTTLRMCVRCVCLVVGDGGSVGVEQRDHAIVQVTAFRRQSRRTRTPGQGNTVGGHRARPLGQTIQSFHDNDALAQVKASDAATNLANTLVSLVVRTLAREGAAQGLGPAAADLFVTVFLARRLLCWLVVDVRDDIVAL